MKDEIKKPNSIEAQEKNKGLRLYEKKKLKLRLSRGINQIE